MDSRYITCFLSFAVLHHSGTCTHFWNKWDCRYIFMGRTCKAIPDRHYNFGVGVCLVSEIKAKKKNGYPLCL